MNKVMLFMVFAAFAAFIARSRKKNED